jgi:hypothetical protein
VRRNLKTVPNMFSVKSNQTVRRRAAVPKSGGGGQYTPDPWRVSEHAANDHWSIVAGSLLNDGRQVALIPDAAMSEESQANARLIAQAPAMHRAAVKLMCVWGTDDAQEAMEELSEILSKAVKT